MPILSLSLSFSFFSPSHKEIKNERAYKFIKSQLKTGNWSTTVPNNGFRTYICVREYVYAHMSDRYTLDNQPN